MHYTHGMESGKLKVSTKQQLEKLVELMEMYPHVGRKKLQFGCNKRKIRGMWEQFAEELNSLGPPSRTAHEWRRVWIHYKANLKRKLANNRSNYLATGGGPSQEISLNPLEESVVQLVQIQDQVTSSARACGQAFGVENILPAIEGEEMEDTSSMIGESQVESHEDRPTSSAAQRVKNRPRRKNLETERLELLKSQEKTQKEVLKKISELEATVYKSYEINKELLHIKQKKFELYARQAKEAHDLHVLKRDCGEPVSAMRKGFIIKDCRWNPKSPLNSSRQSDLRSRNCRSHGSRSILHQFMKNAQVCK